MSAKLESGDYFSKWRGFLCENVGLTVKTLSRIGEQVQGHIPG